MIAHSRQSIRLKGYDYSRPGAYFITVCAQGREILFGEVTEGKMVLNDLGRKVQEVWNALPEHYLQIDLDAFVIMPNHIHGIIFVGAGFKPAHLFPKLEPGHVNSVSHDERAGLKPAPTKWQTISKKTKCLTTFSNK